MDKHRKEFHKYGFMTMIGWNILLVILVFIGSVSKHISPNYIFDDGTGGIGMTIFLLLWSLIWYGIGYKSRKDYVLTRNMYREQNQFDNAFRSNYITKQAKLLSIVFATAIPWYMIGYVDFPMTTKDIFIITILAIVSVFSFLVSRKSLN